MELVTGGSDMWIFIVFVCVTVTAIIIFVNYRRTKKTMDTIEEMLNVAVKGEFTEGQFDETHYIREDLRSAFLSDGKCLRSMLLFCFSLPLHFVRTEQMHLSNGQNLSPKPTCVSRRIVPP